MKKISNARTLRRLEDFVGKKILLSVYNTTVKSHFDYCCDIWDVFGETQATLLQKLKKQNRPHFNWFTK